MKGAASRWIGALVLGAVALPPAVARAADPKPPPPSALPVRAAQIALDNGVVNLTVGFRDVVDAEIREKLGNGFPTVVTMRGYLFRESGGDPIALTARSCRVKYEIWDEVFHVTLSQPGGTTQSVAVNMEGVLRNCCELRKQPLVSRSLLKDGVRYFVASFVEVNPVSLATFDTIKRWVSRPNGSTAIGPGDSLLGSFVGLFVVRIHDADRKLTFRTAAFVPPTPPPPPPPPAP